MKIHSRKFIGLGTVVLACLLPLLGVNPAFCQASDGVQKILVLPPALHASQDMDFLRKGIVDMLTGRLALQDKVAVMTLAASDEPVPANGEAAAALGRKMGADYVVLESVIILGNSVSSDARVLETATGTTALTFSRTGKDQADIIAHIDALAAEINTQLLGRPMTAPAAGRVAGPAPTQPAPAKDLDIHQHPEKLLAGLGRDPEGGGLQSEFGNAPAPAAVRLLMRGRRMDRQIRGVTAGDVDGDGVDEVVCIDSRTILVFRTQQGRLVKMAEFEGGKANIGVDAADLNGNGTDELFITHFDNGKALSYVLEWDGTGFKRIADNLRWYFRSVDMDARGRVLVGQRQGVADLFVSGIYEIEYRGGTYDGAQKLTLPRGRNVFGFARGAVRAAGASDLVDYSRDGYLRVMDPAGREEWTSTDSYGGTANALTVKSKEDPNEKDILFLPSRVHLLDLNGDGLKEILAVRNEDAASAFSRTRLFKQGRLEILKWDQLGLMPVWRTRGVAKFIGDFTVTDVNGDGTPEIVAAIVQKTRNVLSAGSSYLAVFSLDNLTGQ